MAVFGLTKRDPLAYLLVAPALLLVTMLPLKAVELLESTNTPQLEDRFVVPFMERAALPVGSKIQIQSRRVWSPLWRVPQPSPK